MPTDIASRIAALHPEDRAVVVAVLEAVEARELVEQARAVLGVREETPPAPAPDELPPLVLGAHSKSEAKRVAVLKAARAGEHRVQDEPRRQMCTRRGCPRKGCASDPDGLCGPCRELADRGGPVQLRNGRVIEG